MTPVKIPMPLAILPIMIAASEGSAFLYFRLLPYFRKGTGNNKNNILGIIKNTPYNIISGYIFSPNKNL